jgi:hypothetical protein
MFEFDAGALPGFSGTVDAIPSDIPPPLLRSVAAKVALSGSFL